MLQPQARRIRRRDLAAILRLARLRFPDPVQRVAAALACQGLKPWTDRVLRRLTGLTVDEISGRFRQVLLSLRDPDHSEVVRATPPSVLSGLPSRGQN